MAVERFDTAGRPTRVKVGPVDFAVQWRDAEWRDKYDRAGHCNSHYLEMVFSDLTGPNLARVFLHEVCHAIKDFSPLMSDSLNNEQYADLTACGLVAFWRDNPLTFAWWAGLLAEDTHNG